MPKIYRRAAHAGSWYANDGSIQNCFQNKQLFLESILKAQIDTWLENVSVQDDDISVQAIIAP